MYCQPIFLKPTGPQLVRSPSVFSRKRKRANRQRRSALLSARASGEVPWKSPLAR